MKNLEELIQIVTSREAKKMQVSTLPDADTKLFQLFQTISETGSVKNEIISRQLYNENDTRSFRVLKYRLHEKLLQEALRIDASKILRDPCDLAHHRCWRNLLLAQLLFLKFKRHAAINILRQTIQQAKKYQLNGILVMATRLMRYHAAYAGSKTGFLEQDKLLKNSLKNLDAELKVEELSQLIILELHHKISPSDSIRKKSKLLLLEVEKITKRYPTFQNKLNHFRVAVRYFQMTAQHKKVIEWCDKAAVYFDRNKHLVQKGRLAEFALYKMYSSFSLCDFTEGEQCAVTCENLFEAGTDNWLIFLEYYFLLCLHSGNYSKSLEIFYRVTDHPKFKTLPPIRIEKWKIFEAYLNFVLPDTLPKHKFNLFRFINEVPMYSQDKSGFNLTILVAHIILLINIGNYPEVIRMEEALQAYCNRNLRKKKNHRSYYFMKMILVLLKHNMDYTKSMQLARKFLARMKASSEVEQATEELEVIPYDKLWELLLNKVKAKEGEAYNEKKQIAGHVINPFPVLHS